MKYHGSNLTTQYSCLSDIKMIETILDQDMLIINESPYEPNIKTTVRWSKHI